MPAPGTALHVDDDRMMLKLVKGVLGEHGWEVVSAVDGAAAMRHLEAARPALIVLDVNIGDESGYALCARIRREHADLDAPIAFLTGNRTLEDFRQAQAAGGNAFILKPLSPPRLLAGIDQAFQQWRKYRRADEPEGRNPPS